MNQAVSKVVLLAGLLLTGYSNSGDGKVSTSKYLKPGASIDFSHNFKGHLEVGVQDTLNLSFRVPYISGQLETKLRADSGLSMEPATLDYAFSLGENQIYKIQKTINAEQDGKYYLTIFAEVIDSLGQVKKSVFAIAVRVGNQADRPKNKTAPIVESSLGERLIVSPAEETTTQ